MEPRGLSAAEEGDDAPLTRVPGLWQLSLARIGIILAAGPPGSPWSLSQWSRPY